MKLSLPFSWSFNSAGPEFGIRGEWRGRLLHLNLWQTVANACQIALWFPGSQARWSLLMCDLVDKTLTVQAHFFFLFNLDTNLPELENLIYGEKLINPHKHWMDSQMEKGCIPKAYSHIWTEKHACQQMYMFMWEKPFPRQTVKIWSVYYGAFELNGMSL